MQTEKVIEYIVQWLKDYLVKSNQKGFVIGISGGIDSAVTSTLCAKTGAEVLCLEMPIHQAENQVTRAQGHISWLQENFENVSSEKVNLTPVFDSLVETLPSPKNQELLYLSLANTRSRLRMTSLYYFAGLHKYLVAGTGNKVEDFGVGFFTKYGDGGVDISPIADLMKSEVYKIAEFLGVNHDIQKAKPTDGLWGDDRSDEDQLGASYDELEWAMKVYNTDESKNLSGRKLEVLNIYDKLHRAMKHKIDPIPVCEIPSELK